MELFKKANVQWKKLGAKKRAQIIWQAAHAGTSPKEVLPKRDSEKGSARAPILSCVVSSVKHLDESLILFDEEDKPCDRCD